MFCGRAYVDVIDGGGTNPATSASDLNDWRDYQLLISGRRLKYIGDLCLFILPGVQFWYNVRFHT